MKKIAISLFSVATLSMLLSSVQKSAGPPGCHAGEPPNFYDCSACHSGSALNSGTARILLDLDGADLGYSPGQIYHFTVSVKKTGMLAAGFQFLVLQDSDATRSPGEIILTDSSRIQKVDAANPHVQGCDLLEKVWVEHTYNGILSDSTGESRWGFNWKAPDADVGRITFYLAALESNYNAEETGDFVYTRNASANAILSNIGSPKPTPDDVQVFPNPTTSELHVSTEAFPIKKIELLDVSGRSVRQFEVGSSSPGSELLLDLSSLDTGVYLVLIQGKETTLVKKIILRTRN